MLTKCSGTSGAWCEERLRQQSGDLLHAQPDQCHRRTAGDKATALSCFAPQVSLFARDRNTGRLVIDSIEALGSALRN